MEVALIDKQVARLPEVVRRLHGGLEMRARAGGVVGAQGEAPEREMRPGELSQRAAFAAFPRLKTPALQEREGFVVASGLVEKRAEFHAEVVALFEERPMLLQFAAGAGRAIRRRASKVGRVRRGGERRPDWLGTPCRRRRAPLGAFLRILK